MNYWMNDNEYIVTWKPKRLVKSILEWLYKAFSPTIEQYGYKIGIYFNNNALVAEKKFTWEKMWMYASSMIDIIELRNTFNKLVLINSFIWYD